jgi:cytochrome P450
MGLDSSCLEMLSPLVLFFLLVVFTLPLWSLASLGRNYLTARSTGLPILISPVDPFNPIWIIVRPYLNPIFASLPFGWGKFTEYNHLGFEWRDKGRLHDIHGPAYVIATPGLNQLIVADAAAGSTILKQHRTWQKSATLSEPLNIFGPNIGSAEGEDWQRQRKMTAVAFNERNNKLVWEESVKQSQQMLSTWVAKRGDANGVTTTTEDAYLFALNVLTAAGFGKRYDFDSPLRVVDAGHTMSYRDCLKVILSNLFLSYAISRMGRLSFILPPAAKRVHTAFVEFNEYMRDLARQLRTSDTQDDGMVAANLMSILIRASETEPGGTQEKSRNSLTDQEFMGNLFVFNLAGYDTTAGTLSYTIGLLACYPEWQDWIKEELREVFGDRDISGEDYETAFPRLKRCVAVMVRSCCDGCCKGLVY